MFLCVEVENKNSENIVLNLVYPPPNGDHKKLENCLKAFSPNGKSHTKMSF